MAMVPHWIENQRVEPADGSLRGLVENPATEEVLTEVALDDIQATDHTVASSLRAHHTWSRVPVLERARVFFRYRERLEAHREELAYLVAEENGKTMGDAYQEVGRGIEVVELAAAGPNLLKGEILTEVAHGVDTTLVRSSLGVVVGITPYNFPAMIPLWMMPLAVVAGNAFILKPSERTPPHGHATGRTIPGCRGSRRCL